MSFERINVNGIIADAKEMLSSFVPYVEYLCIFPQRYMPSNSQLDVEQKPILKTCTFFVTNESTREKVTLKNIMFDEKTETINFFTSSATNKPTENTLHEYSLTAIVQSIANILEWDSGKQIIIATNGELSFSYGTEYYCVRDINANIVDVCVKNYQSDCYTPTRHSNLEEKEYNYFDLIKN